jgi:hypothetical protein
VALGSILVDPLFSASAVVGRIVEEAKEWSAAG